MEGDFLEVFEPWTDVRETSTRSYAREARPTPGTWEPQPAPGVPEAQPAQRALEAAADSSVQDARADSPVLDSPAAAAAFMRTEGIPEISLAAGHMKAVDHQLVVQDMLDLHNPALRVLCWPRPGLMAASHERLRVTLEFTVLNDEPCEIVARCWTGDPGSDTSTSLGRISVKILNLEWVRERVLDLIRIALRES